MAAAATDQDPLAAADSQVPAASGRRARRVRRALIAAGALAGGAVVVVAAMGFLHTSYGRPLMARLGMGCPANRASPAEVEDLRNIGITALRGTVRAPARPAYGQLLDQSRQAEVTAWARQRGWQCTARARPSRMLTCLNVPAAALATGAGDGMIDEVVFGFAPDGRLVGVETMRSGLSGAQASALFSRLDQGLTQQLGAPGERSGDASPDYLTSAPLHSAWLRYRFADYMAVVTAMNLSGGVGVREQYLSATAAPAAGGT